MEKPNKLIERLRQLCVALPATTCEINGDHTLRLSCCLAAPRTLVRQVEGAEVS